MPGRAASSCRFMTIYARLTQNNRVHCPYATRARHHAELGHCKLFPMGLTHHGILLLLCTVTFSVSIMQRTLCKRPGTRGCQKVQQGVIKWDRKDSQSLRSCGWRARRPARTRGCQLAQGPPPLLAPPPLPLAPGHPSRR